MSLDIIQPAIEELKQRADQFEKVSTIFRNAYDEAQAVLSGEAPKKKSTPATTTASKKQSTTKKKDKAPAAADADADGKRPKNEIKLPDLVLKILNSEKEGMKLDEIVTAVIDSGYQTSSKKAKENPKGAYTQLVYQCLHKLRTRDDGAFVTKDEDSRRYKLTADGKRKAKAA